MPSLAWMTRMAPWNGAVRDFRSTQTFKRMTTNTCPHSACHLTANAAPLHQGGIGAFGEPKPLQTRSMP